MEGGRGEYNEQDRGLFTYFTKAPYLLYMCMIPNLVYLPAWLNQRGKGTFTMDVSVLEV